MSEPVISGADGEMLQVGALADRRSCACWYGRGGREEAYASCRTCGSTERFHKVLGKHSAFSTGCTGPSSLTS